MSRTGAHILVASLAAIALAATQLPSPRIMARAWLLRHGRYSISYPQPGPLTPANAVSRSLRS